MESDPVIEKVQALRKQGDFQAARDILLELAAAEPEYAAVLLLLGDSQAELGEWQAATETFRRAVEHFPNSETVSLALFHCLWDQERQVEALDEMKRFIRTHDSEDYTEMLRDLTAALREEEQQ